MKKKEKRIDSAFLDDRKSEMLHILLSFRFSELGELGIKYFKFLLVLGAASETNAITKVLSEFDCSYWLLILERLVPLTVVFFGRLASPDDFDDSKFYDEVNKFITVNLDKYLYSEKELAEAEVCGNG